MAKNKAVTTPARGTRDFLPAEIHRREFVTRVIRETYEAHGFEPLETPAFERLDTLMGKYGEEGDQLLFKILERGQPLVNGIREASALIASPDGLVKGRSGETAPGAEKLLADMGLRYDLTVPLSRVYAEYQGQLPAVFKRYQIQPVWRADSPGKGRFREFYQCDVDVVGSTDLVVEAEVLGAVAECMLKLGFDDFEILINHRQLLRAFIELAGIDVAMESTALVAIDKLDKVDVAAVLAEMVAKGIPAAGAQSLMDLVNLADSEAYRMFAPSSDPGSVAGSFVANAQIYAKNERAKLAKLDLDRVLELSEHTPAKGRVRHSARLARGLGYYTGCIFEIAAKGLSSSLGGGGRYDGLIGMFLGREVPACGFSIGLERILVVMEERKMFPESTGGVDAIVAAIEASEMPRALSVAYAMRGAGLKVELLSKPEKPGRVRKTADDRNVPLAVLVHREPADKINVWTKKEPDVVDRMIATNEAVELARATRASRA